MPSWTITASMSAGLDASHHRRELQLPLRLRATHLRHDVRLQPHHNALPRRVPWMRVCACLVGS